MARLFLSYCHADRLFAAKLVSFLESEGHDIWWDKKAEVGGRFRDEIEQKIVEAEKLLVVWLRNSVKSDFVPDEATRGRAKLVPLRIDDVDLPLGFGGIHTIDLCDWPKRAEEVLAAVGGPAPSAKSGIMEFLEKPVLSKLERLILINQYEILSLLQEKQAKITS